MAGFLAGKRAGKPDMLSKTVGTQQQSGMAFGMAERGAARQARAARLP
jgi:hypothetical protein